MGKYKFREVILVKNDCQDCKNDAKNVEFSKELAEAKSKKDQKK
jgi:ribosomal protein L15E